jgi:predicted nuclease with TOPRIM domain
MEDKTELENLRAEKLKLELLQEEKDGNLKNLKKKINELEDELRILKSTNTKQEKKFVRKNIGIK